PNKARVNVGAYGNTPQASKSFVRVLTVQSSPAGIAISGSAPGTTNYSTPCDAEVTVGLTAPQTATVGGALCTFVRWKLDGADQPAGVRTIDVFIDGDHTVLAVYSVPPPVASLATSPAQPNGLDGWFVSQPWISLTTTGVGVKQVHYRWNEATWTVVNGSSAGFYAIGGSNTLSYFAVDQFDQPGAEQQTVIKWDNSLPTVSIGLAGTKPGSWYSSAVIVSVSTTAAGGTITSTEIKIDNAAWAPYIGPSVVSSEGWHYIYARIATATGKSVQNSAGFQIDALPPVTTMTTQPATPNGADGWFICFVPQVRLSAGDAAGSVREIRYRWNEGTETIVAGSYAAFNAPVGENVLTYYAVDSHDNAEAPKQATVKFDDSAPDLRVTAINGPAEQWSGRTFDVSWTVKNEGAYVAAGSWIDRIFLSADDQPGDDVQLGSAQYNGSLAINASYSRTISITLPHGIQGQHWLVVRTDVNNSLLESDDNNNVKVSDGAMTVSMSPYPELQITGIVVPPTGQAGQQVSIQWTVRNNGDGPAVGTWTDKIHLSADNQIGGDQQIGTYTYSASILPGQSLVKSTTVTLPVVNASGDQWLVVKVDADDVIFEYNETNNSTISSQPINIPAALTLTFAVAEIAENAQPPIAMGTIRRNTGTAGNLTVNLSNDLPARITVPATVTIPAGQVSATFQATVVNDLLINGTQRATIGASADAFQASSAAVDVLDDE
ncbi:MAG: hypothetical protein E4H19_15730, partial [Chromatiales bacterium]